MNDTAVLNPLAGMTQAKWNTLTPAQKEAIRDYSGLNPQLKGLEGWRVEVTNNEGEVYRFIVGRSTGWIPCHIEIKNARSSGGMAARSSYKSVRALYKVR